MRGRGLMLVAGARMGQRAGYERAMAEQQQQAQQQQLSDAQQQAAMAQQQLQQAQAQPQPQAAAPASGSTNVTAELHKLAELRQSGAITEEEFAAAKRKLLGM